MVWTVSPRWWTQSVPSVPPRLSDSLDDGVVTSYRPVVPDDGFVFEELRKLCKNQK